MAGETARESPPLRPNVQETEAGPLDPQRQHAQLRTLWAEGNKTLRRLDHYRRGQFPVEQVELWWNLGRTLAERGLMVQALPVDAGTWLVGGRRSSGRSFWLTLVDAHAVLAADGHRHVVGIDFDPGAPAWRANAGRHTLAARLARRMGEGLWAVIDRARGWPLDQEWPDIDETLTMLAAIAQEPDRFNPGWQHDWSRLARLWRHRGVWQPMAQWRGPSGYHWIRYDPETGRHMWESG